MVTTAESWPWDTAPVCLITGSSRGLGLACGGALARQGATVLLSARDHTSAVTAAVNSGVAGLHGLDVDLDIADPGAVDAAAAVVQRRFGRLDILINNAAAYVDWSEVATNADLERARQVMDINLFGAWMVTLRFLPLLRSSVHPRIVNVASAAGSHGDSDYGLAARNGSAASYGISKAALLALTTTLAAELAATPVIINAVDPDLTGLSRQRCFWRLISRSRRPGIGRRR